MSNPDLRQYGIVTGGYWAFTITDGAIRMLVVLYFHQLGYSPFEVAMLFLLYEFFGVVTNLTGGLLAARIGLNRTMNIGTVRSLIRRWRSFFSAGCLIPRAAARAISVCL